MDIDNGGLVSDEPQIEKPRPSSKIYFFIIAIAALLATNIYYAVRYKNLGKQVEVLNSQKSQLEIEVDRIEAELDKVTKENINVASKFEKEYDAALLLIEDLRATINASPAITQSDLLKTQQKIRELRSLVDTYSNDLKEVQKKNQQLTSEKIKLEASIDTAKKQVNSLENEKLDLEEKIKLASNLKVSVMSINAIRVRSGNRTNTESKAQRVNKLQINFTLADNTLASTGTHNIYLRITEPSGNLITEGSVFEVNNEEIQYTYMEPILFKNDGKQYTIDWYPKDYKFKKGIYTIILYTKESTMGRATINLK